MINVGIVGATGYTGQELVRILAGHSQANIIALTSKSHTGKRYSSIYPGFTGKNNLDLKLRSQEEITEIAEECDVIFLALPHGLSSCLINDSLLSKVKVVDLGADFRIRDLSTYKKWYQVEHHFAEGLKEAVYGLCEWRRAEIKEARIVANPGCYATCSEMALLPLAKNGLLNTAIIDAKSGVSGAGRSLNIDTHFNECNESIKAYKVANHRHLPEIEQELSHFAEVDVSITFTPHLIPMQRGILVTAYVETGNDMNLDLASKIYSDCYQNEPFVRLRDDSPETRWVKGTNFVDIALTLDARNNRLIVLAALDNLVKGAAGQAVQNMNIMFGFEETLGLGNLALFP